MGEFQKGRTEVEDEIRSATHTEESLDSVENVVTDDDVETTV